MTVMLPVEAVFVIIPSLRLFPRGKSWEMLERPEGTSQGHW